MFNRSHLLIVVLAIGGALAGLFAGAWLRPMPSAPVVDGAQALALGSRRPNIVLPDLDGRTRSLSQWDGRLLLVNFWASWCGPCREEMPLLDRTQQRLADRGVQIVGIAADTAEATKGFLGRHPVHYPILVNDPDHGRDVSLDYGDTRGVLPYSVLIGRDGRILAHRFGNFTEESLQAWLTPHL